MIAGRFVAPNISGPLLQRGFSMLCVVVGLLMLGKAYFGLS
jgi:hypothetical protein